MGKLEKLREVNKTLNKILINIETRIFVENLDIDNKKINETKQNVIVEPKQ
jgi:hypothetical protein